MTFNLPDIDIDLPDRNKLLRILPHIKASRINNDNLIEHGPGIHIQRMPTNFENNLSLIPYQEAESLGYWKLDVLNNIVPYENVKSKLQMRQILEEFKEWELFEYKEIVEKLFHIHEHADFVTNLKPKSIHDLAVILAIIRPWGQKLLNSNLSKEEFETLLWNPQDSYVGFKKSHAYAYAAAIIIQVATL